MIQDAIDRIGSTILWMFLVLGVGTAILTLTALFVNLAIRSTIRYIWRRFTESRL
jgi:hypothetical protein